MAGIGKVFFFFFIFSGSRVIVVKLWYYDVSLTRSIPRIEYYNAVGVHFDPTINQTLIVYFIFSSVIDLYEYTVGRIF